MEYFFLKSFHCIKVEDNNLASISYVMLYNYLHIDQSIVRQYIQFTCNLNIVFILDITVDRIKKFLSYLFTGNLENVTIKELVVEYSHV